MQMRKVNPILEAIQQQYQKSNPPQSHNSFSTKSKDPIQSRTYITKKLNRRTLEPIRNWRATATVWSNCCPVLSRGILWSPIASFTTIASNFFLATVKSSLSFVLKSMKSNRSCLKRKRNFYITSVSKTWKWGYVPKFQRPHTPINANAENHAKLMWDSPFTKKTGILRT